MASTRTEIPWYEAYPAAKSDPASILRPELLGWLKDGKEAGKDFALVDLRRTDFEVYANLGAGTTRKLTMSGWYNPRLHQPACPESLSNYSNAVYSFKSAGVSKVIWYCGSSRGRGNRAAAWFSDHIVDQGDQSMQSLVLREGVKGWAQAGAEYTEQMVDYDSKVWAEG